MSILDGADVEGNEEEVGTRGGGRVLQGCRGRGLPPRRLVGEHPRCAGSVPTFLSLREGMGGTELTLRGPDGAAHSHIVQRQSWPEPGSPEVGVGNGHWAGPALLALLFPLPPGSLTPVSPASSPHPQHRLTPHCQSCPCSEPKPLPGPGSVPPQTPPPDSHLGGHPLVSRL